MDNIQKKMTKLWHIDQELCRTTSSVVDAVSKPRVPDGALLLAGSCFEGAMLSRWWYHADEPRVVRENDIGTDRRDASAAAISQGTNRLEDIVTKEIEIDLMYIAATVTEEYKNILEPIPGKPGYVEVRVDTPFMECLEPVLVGKIHQVVTDGYLDSYKAKNIIRKKARFSDRRGTINWVLGAVFAVAPQNVGLTVNEELSKASYKCDISFRIGDKHALKYSSDHVPSIRLAFWPEIAAGWLDGDSRGRKWPPPGDIKSIRDKGCHIVARPSSQGDVHRELRFSFSQPEMTLASMRSFRQNIAYFLFKTLFYMWIKPLDSEHMVSYFGKTIMLWATERYPPDHAYWKEDALAQSIDYLLSMLTLHFKNGHLSHFFIPDINVMADVPEESRSLAVSKLLEIREDLAGHIPSNLDEVTNMASKFCRWMKAGEAFHKVLKCCRA